MHQIDTGFAPESSVAPTIPVVDSKQELWFSEQVLPHEPGLRAWLRARFPSLADGDDVVQESYFRLMRARRSREVGDAKAYLFTTARNVVFDLFRRKRATPVVALAEVDGAAVVEERTGVAEAACTAQEIEILRQAIDALPDRCRAVIILQKIHGLSNQEIAERLELSVHTVNAQMVIGLARCRRYLLARGVLPGGRA